MRRALLHMVFLGAVSFGQAQVFAPVGSFELSVPIIEVDSVFFVNSCNVQIRLGVEGEDLRYSLSGASVAHESLSYKSPIVLASTTVIRTQAQHMDYLPSTEEIAQVYKLSLGQVLIKHSQPAPAAQYKGPGLGGLTDKQKGGMNFRDGHWLGFDSESIQLDLVTAANQDKGKIILSVLKDQASWIFMPDKVTLEQDGNVISIWEAERFKSSKRSFQFIELPPSKAKKGKMELKVQMGNIPSWHEGNGGTPWFFIDEIFISE